MSEILKYLIAFYVSIHDYFKKATSNIYQIFLTLDLAFHCLITKNRDYNYNNLYLIIRL